MSSIDRTIHVKLIAMDLLCKSLTKLQFLAAVYPLVLDVSSMKMLSIVFGSVVGAMGGLGALFFAIIIIEAVGLITYQRLHELTIGSPGWMLGTALLVPVIGGMIIGSAKFLSDMSPRKSR